MLAENLVEEFEMKEDEPWYDHQDLQQGEGAVAAPPPRLGRAAGLGWMTPERETVKKLLLPAASGRQVREGPALTWFGHRPRAQPVGRPLLRSDPRYPCVWAGHRLGG